jgi:hypothetical protein
MRVDDGRPEPLGRGDRRRFERRVTPPGDRLPDQGKLFDTAVDGLPV